jgi:NAD(P)H-flavin reductase
MKKASASRSRSRAQIQSAAPSTSSSSRQQKTTHLLNSLETGDQILDMVGPRGKPSEIANYGTVVVVGGGVGA